MGNKSKEGPSQETIQRLAIEQLSQQNQNLVGALVSLRQQYSEVEMRLRLILLDFEDGLGVYADRAIEVKDRRIDEGIEETEAPDGSKRTLLWLKLLPAPVPEPVQPAAEEDIEVSSGGTE